MCWNGPFQDNSGSHPVYPDNGPFQDHSCSHPVSSSNGPFQDHSCSHTVCVKKGPFQDHSGSQSVHPDNGPFQDHRCSHPISSSNGPIQDKSCSHTVCVVGKGPFQGHHVKPVTNTLISPTGRANYIKLVHWNAQGAISKTSAIKTTIVQDDIDIVMIQDTSADRMIFPI